jgi:hypothetical protein
LGVGLGLKDHVGCLSNQRGFSVTLLSLEQQNITQKRKASKHIQSIFQVEEIIIGFATLFVIYKTKKNPITITIFINQQHNQPMLCYILQHSLVFTKPKKTLKTTKQIPSYSQARNHCSLVMTLLFSTKKKPKQKPKMQNPC